MKLLHSYTNGNYVVKLYDNGTKIRETEEDSFISEFPESIDLKITNKCNLNCSMCHEQSTINGLHGDINLEFINTLHKGTELAIGGGDVFQHPQLLELLNKVKQQGIIANITVNQAHIMQNIYTIKYLIDNKLIYGLGISFNNNANNLKAILNEFTKKQRQNIVLHIINGVVEPTELFKLKELSPKVLILGYKQVRKGQSFYNENSTEIKKLQQKLERALPILYSVCNTVSFDNLAIKQLNMQAKVKPEIWKEQYMGDDGQYTMYIDLPNKQFASSSTSSIRYDITDDIVNMFQTVKGEKCYA